MNRAAFNALNGPEQGSAILAGAYVMPKGWARAFIREQGRFHIACWAVSGFALWRIAWRTLGQTDPRGL